MLERNGEKQDQELIDAQSDRIPQTEVIIYQRELTSFLTLQHAVTDEQENR